MKKIFLIEASKNNTKRYLIIKLIRIFNFIFDCLTFKLQPERERDKHYFIA